MCSSDLIIVLGRVGPYQIVISEGYRSNYRQAQLYAQGRTTGGNIVTGARPGQSLHNHGRAIDVTFIDRSGRLMSPDEANSLGLYEKIVPVADQMGIRWGGRFPGLVDKPHFEL